MSRDHTRSKRIIVRVDARYIGRTDARKAPPKVNHRCTYAVGSPLVRVDVELLPQSCMQRRDRLLQAPGAAQVVRVAVAEPRADAAFV